MAEGCIVNLDMQLAPDAARFSLDHGLPMADSIVLATARAHDAILWTQDAHLAGLDGVQYRAK